MTRHSFIITYDTETKTWEWDVDQESNRLDGTVEINGNFESIGSSNPALMEMEDIMSTRLGTSLRILNEHEATNPVVAEAFASPLYYDATLLIDGVAENRIMGIIPHGFKGETADLPHDERVFYWLEESEAKAGFSGEDFWSIDDFNEEVSL
jgi:hypothetical protein